MLAYLHDGPTILQRHSHTFLLLKRNAPHGLTLGDQLADEMTSLQIPDLDAAVATAADNPGIVELQARDAVIVGGKAVDGAEPLERPHPHGAVAAARDKRAAAHLQLPNERCMALEDGLALPGADNWLVDFNASKDTIVSKAAYPVWAFQIRTLVSRLPVATLLPSKAIA